MPTPAVLSGAPGLTLAAGAVVHELHVIDGVRCLGETKTGRGVFTAERQRTFSTVSRFGSHHQPEEGPADRNWFSRRHPKGLGFPQPLKQEQMERAGGPAGVRGGGGGVRPGRSRTPTRGGDEQLP